jgi:hypothetical protein
MNPRNIQCIYLWLFDYTKTGAFVKDLTSFRYCRIHSELVVTGLAVIVTENKSLDRNALFSLEANSTMPFDPISALGSRFKSSTYLSMPAG